MHALYLASQAVSVHLHLFVHTCSRIISLLLGFFLLLFALELGQRGQRDTIILFRVLANLFDLCCGYKGRDLMRTLAEHRHQPSIAFCAFVTMVVRLMVRNLRLTLLRSDFAMAKGWAGASRAWCLESTGMCLA
jgi:hypothetical protein